MLVSSSRLLRFRSVCWPKRYDLAFELIKRFSEIEVTVRALLMQVDKLVQLLESPIFAHLRLQLLDVDSTYHAPLL
jgi:vacuole morphology and inheritance protein 14